MHLRLRIPMVVAALLCVAIAAIHVDDQGGITALTDPTWMGWGYRLLEVGSLAVAGGLLFCAGAAATGTVTRLVWVATALIAVGPLAGYLLSRSVGLPQDSDDIGNWNDPLGTVSLVVEGVLLLVAILAITRVGAPASVRDRSTASEAPVAPEPSTVSV